MSLPEGYSFRKLQIGDYSKNYVETLKVLTTVGDISEQQYIDLFNYWSSKPDIFHPHVITDAQGVVVATGMLLVERKLIHHCGSVGHIEDIAVDTHQQGKKLGWYMITNLAKLSEELKCYKVILDCDAKNVGFYEKCGFKSAGTEMQKRFI